MQHDNHNNHQIDQQLRELEQYSLPDLSKQDDHWKSMAAMIGTSMMMPGTQPRKGFFSRSIIKWITGAVVVGGASFIVYIIATNNKEESDHATQSERLPKEQQVAVQATPPADTAKAIPANPVFSDSAATTTSDMIATIHGNRDMSRDTTIRKTTATVYYGKKEIHNVFVTPPVTKAIPVVDSFIAINNTNNPVISTPVKQLNDFFRQLQKRPEQFRINNGRDTVLRGKEGTVLHIPKNSFNVNGYVTIILTEFYSIEDMIANKLSTVTTDGRQLVSGGMVHISASGANSDSLLSLRNGTSWQMEMPKTTDSSMQLFYGQTIRNSEVFDTEVKWEATGQQFQQPVITLFDTTKRGNGTSRLRIPINDSVFFIAPERKKGFLNSLFGRRKYRFSDEQLARNPNKRPPGTYDTIRGGTLMTGMTAPVQQRIKNAGLVVNNVYGVNISQLGWINCDRFLGERLTTNFSVSLDTPMHYRAILVFDRLKSVMQGTYWEKDRSTFYNIPIGEKVKVICVGIDGGKTISAMKEFIVEPNQKFDLTFEEVDVPAFVRQLQPPKSQ